MPSRNLKDSQILDDNHAEKRIIPKFASFRPKPATPAPEDEQRKPLPSDRRHSSSVHASFNDGLNRHRKRSSKGHLQDRQQDRTEQEETQQTYQSDPTAIQKQQERTLQSYVIDGVGDPNNLIFGASHQYQTPLYFRFGSGNVLGCPSGQKINRSVSSQKGIVISLDGHDLWSRGNRRALRKAASTGVKELKIRPSPSCVFIHDIEADFLPLRSAQQFKRRGNDVSNTGSSSNPDGGSTNYRSARGPAKPERSPGDQNVTYATDTSQTSGDESDHTCSADNIISKNRVELSKEVERNPTDSDAWLNLIDCQDQSLSSSTVPANIGHTHAEQKSVAEIRLSMYEKALDNVKDSRGREILLFRKMQEATRVWDVQKLFTTWQRILKDNPDHLTLWKEYLDLKQSTFASFRYEDVQGTYHNCLKLLKDTPNRPGLSNTEAEKRYELQIYVLLRLTVLMRESGFAEQAMAAWQALLEYEFFRPSDLQDPEYKEGGSLRGTSVSRFENFWDSEVPRIGENGSKGWAAFSQAAEEPPQPKVDSAIQLKGISDGWLSWVKSEHRHSLLARSPARTLDDVAENDPYRVIIFSDIRSFLIDSPSIAMKGACLNAFLAFCQLPPYHEKDLENESRNLWSDGYLRNEVLTSQKSILDSFMDQASSQETNTVRNLKAFQDEPRLTSDKPSVFDLPISNYRLSSDTLFTATGSWFSGLDMWCKRLLDDREPFEREWVLRTVRQLVLNGAGGDKFAEYYLALELRLYPKDVRKTARSLLKNRPSSLLLYNAYALIEFRLGNATKAENALLTSINMGKSLDEATRDGSIALWRTWVWETLMAGDTEKALRLIMMYGHEEFQSGTSPSNLSDDQSARPSLFLRTEMSLTATRDHLLSLGQYYYAAFAIDCLILFSYLKNSSTLAAATSAFQSNCSMLMNYVSPYASTHQSLHQSFARLLYYHATHTRLVKPNDLRFLLAGSIKLFPDNTMFLSLYAWNEARFRIDDRVRSIIKEVVFADSRNSKRKRQESVISHFFAVHSELTRGVTFGGNTSTVRSTFERAVESESGAHCAGLWSLYFAFERSRGDLKEAKSVFWRAIRACPWAKELYLLPFKYLRGAGGFGNEELRGVYELMEEKEMRIHVKLEDYFDSMNKREATSLPRP